MFRGVILQMLLYPKVPEDMSLFFYEAGVLIPLLHFLKSPFR